MHTPCALLWLCMYICHERLPARSFQINFYYESQVLFYFFVWKYFQFNTIKYAYVLRNYSMEQITKILIQNIKSR